MRHQSSILIYEYFGDSTLFAYTLATPFEICTKHLISKIKKYMKNWNFFFFGCHKTQSHMYEYKMQIYVVARPCGKRRVLLPRIQIYKRSLYNNQTRIMNKHNNFVWFVYEYQVHFHFFLTDNMIITHCHISYYMLINTKYET